MCECVTDGVWGNIIGWHKVGWDRFLWWDVAVWCIALWLLPPPRSEKQDGPDNLPLPVMVHDIRDINVHMCRDTYNSCGDIHKRTSHPPSLWSCPSFSADRDTWDADVQLRELALRDESCLSLPAFRAPKYASLRYSYTLCDEIWGRGMKGGVMKS